MFYVPYRRGNSCGVGGAESVGVNFVAPALLILRIHLLQSWCNRRFHMVCFILGNEDDELREGTM
jgi:hypothetical protein